METRMFPNAFVDEMPPALKQLMARDMPAQPQPMSRRSFLKLAGAGGLALIGSRPVIFCRPLITASSEPSTCSARPSVAMVRFFTRPASSR